MSAHDDDAALLALGGCNDLPSHHWLPTQPGGDLRVTWPSPVKGAADLIAGLRSDRYGDNSGAVAILPGDFRGTHTLSELVGTTIYGTEASASAYRPRALGDLRGDGLPDFAVGATGATGDDDSAGAVFVYSGGGF